MHLGHVVLALAVLFLIASFIGCLCLPVLPPIVRRLGISLHYPLLGVVMANPTTAQKVPFTITPRDGPAPDGNIVDLPAFPTALTGITWSVDGDVASIAADASGLSAMLTPAKAGVSVVTVSGTNVLGEVVTDSASVTFDQAAPAVPVVKSLNVAGGEPIAM